MKINWQFETYYNNMADGYRTEPRLGEIPRRIVDSIEQMFKAAHTDHNGTVYQKDVISVRVLVSRKGQWFTEIFIGEDEHELPWLEFSASSALDLARRYEYLTKQIIAAKM